MKSELFNDLKKYETALRKRTNETGATSLLGLSLESLEKGHVVFSMRVKPRHKQIHGVVHGGVLATVADTVAAIAAYTTVPKGTEIATVEMKINFLEAVPGGRIRAEGKVLRTGRNFVVTECEIYKEDGTMAAKALLTFAAAPGHSIPQNEASEELSDYSSPPDAASSPSLWTYLITRLKMSKFGLPWRVSLMQSRSYHSTVPRKISPLSRTTTMEVWLCICLTQ